MSSTSKDRKKHITLAEVVTSASALLTPVTEIMTSISFRKLSKWGQNCSVAKWGLSYLGLIFFFFLSQGSKDSRSLSLLMVVFLHIPQKSHTVKVDFCHCHRVTSSLAIDSIYRRYTLPMV